MKEKKNEGSKTIYEYISVVKVGNKGARTSGFLLFKMLGIRCS